MDDIATVTELLYSYYIAFSSLDPEAIAPYFHEPCIFISPQGVTDAPAHDDLKDVLRAIAEGFRQRGYKRSELTALHVNKLSDGAILATGIAVRYKIDGDVLEQAGVTYVMYRSGNQWKIAVTVIHDAGATNLD